MMRTGKSGGKGHDGDDMKRPASQAAEHDAENQPYENAMKYSRAAFLQDPSLMRRHLPLLILLTATLIVGCIHGTPRSSPTAGGEAAEVEAFFRSGIEAFNAHDLDTFMRQFAHDVDMYTPTGWLRGKEAVRERFSSTFSQFPNVRMELEDLRARKVAPDTVVTDFRWRVYPMGKGPAFHGYGTGVYVRRDGAWVEVLEHETVTRVDEGLPR